VCRFDPGDGRRFVVEMEAPRFAAPLFLSGVDCAAPAALSAVAARPWRLLTALLCCGRAAIGWRESVGNYPPIALALIAPGPKNAPGKLRMASAKSTDRMRLPPVRALPDPDRHRWRRHVPSRSRQQEVSRMTSASPTVRRRELGARLRALRTDAGMTVDDVATRMEVSPAKISRIETGARGVSVADVRFLCDLYRVSAEERERLLNLTRESKRRSWWQQYGLPESVATYIGLEDAAVSIHQYETSLIPGLLQTMEYATALTSGVLPEAASELVDQIVQSRLTRQARLSEENPPELWAVLDEAALLRTVGSTEIMRKQLEELIIRSRRPNVTVQVIPLDAGAHPGLDSAFEILHLEEISDVVHIEGLLGSFFLQSPGDLTRYQRAFDQLRAIALSPRDSRDRMSTIADRLSP
jgi:transcriptional regulator with XRE-family HTH domain